MGKELPSGARVVGSNPGGKAIRHAFVPVTAYSPWILIFHCCSSAEAVATTVIIAIAAIITNTANFFMLVFI
jgi:hypothetical protein